MSCFKWEGYVVKLTIIINSGSFRYKSAYLVSFTCYRIYIFFIGKHLANITFFLLKRTVL